MSEEEGDANKGDPPRNLNDSSIPPELTLHSNSYQNYGKIHSKYYFLEF